MLLRKSLKKNFQPNSVKTNPTESKKPLVLLKSRLLLRRSLTNPIKLNELFHYKKHFQLNSVKKELVDGINSSFSESEIEDIKEYISQLQKDSESDSEYDPFEEKIKDRAY